MKRLKFIISEPFSRIIIYIMMFGLIYLITYSFVYSEIAFLLSALIPTICIDYLRINSKWNYTLLADSTKEIRNIISIFGIFLVNLIITFLIISILGITISVNNNFNFDLKFEFIIIILLLISAISEEVLFRGIIFDALNSKFGLFISIMLTSTLFSSVHFFNNNFNLNSFINTFVAGILFSLITIKTKSLLSTILFHFLWNLSLVFFLDSPLSGFNYDLSIFNINYPEFSVLLGNNYGMESGFLVTFLLIFNIDLLNRFLFESPYITSKLFIRTYSESKILG